MAFEYSGEISTTDPVCVEIGRNLHVTILEEVKLYPDLGLKQAPQQSLLVTPFTFQHFRVYLYTGHVNSLPVITAPRPAAAF